MRKRLILALAVLASSAAHAEKTPKLTPDMRAVLAEIVNDDPARRTPAEWAEQARDTVLSLDMDGGGFSARDVEIAAQMETARDRLNRLGNYLAFDLDGDGQVTAAEYRTGIGKHYVELARIEQDDARKEKRAPKSVTPQEQNDYQYLLRLFAGVDSDGDGAISLAEAYKAASTRLTDPPRPGTGTIRYLSLDLNHDGAVTADEIDAAMGEYLRLRADADWEKLKAARKNMHYSGLVLDEAPGAAPPPRSCDFPQPRGGAKLLRIGIYKGDQISSIALSGQDHSTTVVTIDIEPGREPLYLVASQFEAVVWTFTGAVDRIDRFVIASTTTDDLGRPAAGAIGLPEDKVAMIRIACVGSLFGMPQLPDKTEAGGLMREHFGRRADAVLGFYEPTGLKLPSGTPFAVPEHRPAGLEAKGDADVDAEWRELQRFSSAGVAEIDPSSIVSVVEPQPYETLPQEAGLTQLMIQGKLVRLPNGNFLIQGPMRYPPGLGGSHSVRFIVKDGVPPPVGGGGQ